MQPPRPATLTQPFQGDLQPQIQETYRTTHIDTTTRCRTQRRNPHPQHARGTFHRRLQPLYAEKYKVSCSGFLPKTKPRQHSCSHYNIRFAASRSKPASLYTHGNTRWQQSCSHHNAICNHRFKKRAELRTQTQPLVPEHRGGTNRVRNDRRRTCRTHEVPFTAGRSHFTPKNLKGFLVRLPPQNIAHATFMQPFQCDLQPQLQETQRTMRTGTTTRCRTQRRNQNDRSRNRRTQEVPFIPGRSHFTRKNARVRAAASSPNPRSPLM